MSSALKLDEINAVELYQAGRTLQQIADLAHCKESTVSLYLRKRNVSIRHTGVPGARYPIGAVIGNWEVISDDFTTTNYHSGIKQYCRCRVCGYCTYVQVNLTKTQNSTRCVKCKSSKILLDNGELNIPYIIEFYYNNIKKNISRRNKVSKLEFNITPEYLIRLYLQQKGKCAISGLDLIDHAIKLADLPLSLDRIDSMQGYIQGNVQWVHKDINMMKQSFSNERFIGICCQIALHQAFNPQ